MAKQEFLIKNFYNRMRILGYTIEQRGGYLRIKPYGYNKFFRLDKLGAGYTEVDIEARIKKNAIECQWIPMRYYKPIVQYLFLFFGVLYFAGFVMLVATLTERTALTICISGGTYLALLIYYLAGSNFLRGVLNHAEKEENPSQ